ncbi:MAG: hypothetical protein ACE14S_10430 [Candidatus Bathyarchaeia archaeon]
MQARILEQSQIEQCKIACRRYFEQRLLTVTLDQPIAANVEWSPMVYARNDEQFGVHIKAKPCLEPLWLDIFRISVRPNRPNLKICVAFPFEVALRLTRETLESLLRESLSIITVYEDSTIDLFDSTQSQVPARYANTIIQQLRERKAGALSTQLATCQRGRTYFVQYENLCLDIFKTIFVPPLSQPSSQSTTLSTLRRRDHVFPNYAKQGFWFDVVRQTYMGKYIIVECKNLTTRVTQEEIEDAARYLNKKSTGLFAIVFSRQDPNANAKKKQVEEWNENQKMIITLNDNEVLSLIELYRTQDDPSQIIQQKIDEFIMMIG